MVTKTQSPIERLREIAAEQHAIIEQMTCTVDGINYAIDTDGETINEWVSGCDVTRFIPLTRIRLIAREILGMVEPSEVPTQPEPPTESKQEPWAWATETPKGWRYTFLHKEDVERYTQMLGYNPGTLKPIPLYAAPVKATVWVIKDKDERTVLGFATPLVLQAMDHASELDALAPRYAPHRVVGLAEVEG